MSTEETAVERRARLRRMKILADSEKRMGRIISGEVGGSSGTATPSSSSNDAVSGTGNSSSSTSKDCDSQVWSSEASNSQREHQHQQIPLHEHQSTSTSSNTVQNAASASTSSLQGEIDAYFQVSSRVLIIKILTQFHLTENCSTIRQHPAESSSFATSGH